MVLAFAGDSTITSAPPPPDPFVSTSSSATLPRREADFPAAFALERADAAFFFFVADDARAEAPRPAIRLTVVLVASSVDFFLIAISLVCYSLTARRCSLRF